MPLLLPYHKHGDADGEWRVDNFELWTNRNIKKVTVAAASKNNGLTALLAA